MTYDYTEDNLVQQTKVLQWVFPTNGFVSLKIYDVLGREVAKLVDGIQETGYKSIEFKADNLPTGVYFYKLSASNYTSIKKMLFLR